MTHQQQPTTTHNVDTRDPTGSKKVRNIIFSNIFHKQPLEKKKNVHVALVLPLKQKLDANGQITNEHIKEPYGLKDQDLKSMQKAVIQMRETFKERVKYNSKSTTGSKILKDVLKLMRSTDYRLQFDDVLRKLSK